MSREAFHVEDRHRQQRPDGFESRVQLALNVDNLDESIAFYSNLFGTEPAKRRPGYANFAVARAAAEVGPHREPRTGRHPQPPRRRGRFVDQVDAEQTRLAGAGLASVDERGTACCYAKQDKFWVEGAPNGERWEIYTVLADSATPGGPAEGSNCNCGNATQTAGAGAEALESAGSGCCN